LVRFVVEGDGGGGVSTIKITWADTRAAQRRRPGSPIHVPLLLIFHLTFSLPPPRASRPALLPTLPGPRTPSGSTSTRSPPTLAYQSPFPRYYLQFARYRVQVQASSAHLRFYTSDRELTGYDSELTRFTFEGMHANEREMKILA